MRVPLNRVAGAALAALSVVAISHVSASTKTCLIILRSRNSGPRHGARRAINTLIVIIVIISIVFPVIVIMIPALACHGYHRKHQHDPRIKRKRTPATTFRPVTAPTRPTAECREHAHRPDAPDDHQHHSDPPQECKGDVHLPQPSAQHRRQPDRPQNAKRTLRKLEKLSPGSWSPPRAISPRRHRAGRLSPSTTSRWPGVGGGQGRAVV